MDTLDLNTLSHLLSLIERATRAPLQKTDAFCRADDRRRPRLLTRHTHRRQLALDLSHRGTTIDLLGEHASNQVQEGNGSTRTKTSQRRRLKQVMKHQRMLVGDGVHRLSSQEMEEETAQTIDIRLGVGVLSVDP